MANVADPNDKAKAKQPPWAVPKPAYEQPVLKVYNSMTRTKDVFVPMNGHSVKWYNCGPTVYDSSHLGHARNYVTQDILRRIMVDYFGYDVHFVMNITDIDDKIITRARYQYLTNRLRDQTTSLSTDTISTVTQAFSSYTQKKLNPSLPANDILAAGSELQQWPHLYELSQKDPAWVKAGTEKDEKFTMHINSLNAAFSGIKAAETSIAGGKTGAEPAHALLASSLDVLGPWLDGQFKAEVTDHEIFRSLAAYWEDSFMSDMARLKVQPPDTLTRVTEYVPEIVAYVEKIISNGYAYATPDGSVYFNTEAFHGAKSKGVADGEIDWNHSYAKLMPWNTGNKALLDEAEGSLATGTGKRAAADFALWKASKPGEPAWPSPWGQGRPGWHIECSVMATEILGDNMDIHSGGIDLAFPHHDNEIAQSEAYHDCRQWVNYFLHTGHLHIEGLKMSKSLKNFITIDQALALYSPRQLRLLFLGQLWNAKFDFRDSAVSEAKSIESTFENFFNNVKALVAESKGAARSTDTRHHYDQTERELTDSLHKTQHDFRVALSDSFNTPEALARLVELVSKTNLYLARGRKEVNIGVVRNVAVWVTKMLRTFGLAEGPGSDSNTIGWGRSSANGESETFDRDAVLMPYLTALSTFRDDVRKLAIGQAPTKEILMLCDKLRDVDLAPLGVQLDDQEDGRALVKLVDPAVLLREREEKAAQAAEKAARKAAAAEAEKAKRLAKLEKGKLAPAEMFKPPNVPEGTYSTWNDEGFPLSDGEGVELPKSKVKKLTKDWDNQKKAHAEWLAYAQENSIPI
ncbi:hypothetical protein DL93DRAFT_2050709 [Clavulina sp. PMI_390]|nr:hypothetical protein DL93DRAFT_2050709 [Clavulina sp. PMI_390]